MKNAIILIHTDFSFSFVLFTVQGIEQL